MTMDSQVPSQPHIVSMRYDSSSFVRKCEKTVHSLTTTDRRYTLCLKSPLKSVLSISTHHNSKTIELLRYHTNLPYIKFNMSVSSMKNLYLLRKQPIFNEGFIINSMKDCDGATFAARLAVRIVGRTVA